MKRKSMSRRTFLSTASATAAGLGLSAAVVRGAPGSNERISIGMIGLGGRGGGDHLPQISKLAATHNARVTAVCDVWQVNLKRAAAQVAKTFGAEPQMYTRFDELLGRKDIDAVTIATPDFSHGPILVAALKAGKDVYVEKPMTIQLSYATEALDLARKNERVVQAGTQYRSSSTVLGVAKEVASGSIGKISRFSSAVSFNHPRWKRNEHDCVEKDVDWDAYLLDLPKRPFDASLLREWQLHRETSNGLPGLWMVHYVDAMALMLNVKYPASVVAHGGNYVWKDGREHADTFTALLEYPEGFLFDWGMSLGTNADCRCNIYGVDGTLTSEGSHFITGPWQVTSKAKGQQGQADKPVSRPVGETGGGNHMENFLECVRSRQRPRADIQFGHQHAVASIMAAEALRTGRRQKYDPATRTIQPA